MPGELGTLQQFGTHSFAFLIGAMIGAAGTYYGQWATDRRRRKQAVREARSQFQQVAKTMPRLIAQIRNDLQTEGEKHARTAWVISKTDNFGMRTSGFRYHPQEHRRLAEKFEILAENGYVERIPHHQIPKYRLKEHFVALVLE